MSKRYSKYGSEITVSEYVCTATSVRLINKIIQLFTTFKILRFSSKLLIFLFATLKKVEKNTLNFIVLDFRT